MTNRFVGGFNNEDQQPSAATKWRGGGDEGGGKFAHIRACIKVTDPNMMVGKLTLYLFSTSIHSLLFMKTR